MENLERQVDERLATAEAALRSAPFQVEQGSRKWAVHHFEWLVRFQLNGESCKRIGSDVKFKAARSTVEEGCQRAAEMLFSAEAHSWLRQRKNRGRSHQKE